jgi:four helix bundle protein
MGVHMSGEVVDHRDLKVWQQSIDIVCRLYDLTKNFPPAEQFGLVSQMRRAAVSIPSNISEGAARASTREFIQFLRIALGSLAELETQMIISGRLGFIKDGDEFCASLLALRKMLTSMITKLGKNL